MAATSNIDDSETIVEGDNRLPERISRLLQDTTGGDLKLFCSKTNGVVSTNNLRHYIRGESEPRRAGLVAIAEAGNCSLEWLLTGHNPNDGFELEDPIKVMTMKYASELILNGVYDTESSVTQEDIVEYDKNFIHGSTISEINLNRAWLRSLGVDPKSVVLVSAHDYVMAPTINAGDILIVDAQNREVDGGMFFILYNSNPEFRRVVLMPDSSYKLINDNPVYPDITVPNRDFIRVLGRVSYIFRGKLI